MGMILTSECEGCGYGVIDDRDKARVKVTCTYKVKEYFYGQCVPCDNKIKKRRLDNEDSEL